MNVKGQATNRWENKVKKYITFGDRYEYEFDILNITREKLAFKACDIYKELNGILNVHFLKTLKFSVSA